MLSLTRASQATSGTSIPAALAIRIVFWAWWCDFECEELDKHGLNLFEHRSINHLLPTLPYFKSKGTLLGGMSKGHLVENLRCTENFWQDCWEGGRQRRGMT